MSKEDNLIPFTKGHKRKLPDPEKQKARRKLKDLLTDFAHDKFEDFVSEYDKLRGKPKCDIYIKMLEFVQPRISAVQFEDLKEARDAVTLLRDFAKYRQDQEE
jgi:hypothetical protein